ncbi:putative WAT1-related protein, partial [Tanacetum coccineum]
MSGAMNDVPKQVLDVLPYDPFEQIDIARKITSIALSTRVSSLESQSSILLQDIAARDDVIVDLQSHLHSLDFSLSQDLHSLSVADHQKENLLKENASLLETVNKLKRDVAKINVIYQLSEICPAVLLNLISEKKTLMMSLQDEEENLARGPPEYEESTSSIQSHSSSVGISYHDEHVTDASSRPRISQSLLFASQTSSPWLTPPETPPTLSASASPTRTPPPVSPRRHSFSAAPTSGTFYDRSSVYSSANSSPYASMTGGTRVDSKEFFRQVRSRLAYEQFAAFLANVKELNSQKQSEEASV